MSGHTPGPWKCELFYNNGDKYSEVEPKNYKTCELHEPICIIPHDDVSEESEPEMLANARLIVAAPDLLAALLWVADHPYAGGKSFRDAPIVKAALNKVRP